MPWSTLFAAACAAAALAAADTRPVIVTFGDSLTAFRPGESYPDYLQKDFDARGFKYRVVNEGVPGDTSTDGLARLANVLVHKPRVVVLEFGGNDGLRGVPVSTTRGNLDRIIVELRKAGATVVLAGMTLPPNYGPEYVKSFEQVFSSLAAKHRLKLIPFLLEGVALTPGLMSPDGIHPNAKGNQRVAQTVFRALEPLLRKN